MPVQVIIVDDDPIVGSLTLELLQEAGFSALLIQDSLTAQDAIKKEQPGLVLLDILMPGIDGLTLLHRLKSDPATSKLKVVILSGKSFASEKGRAMQYGAELFIEKPYDVDDFAKKVAGLLNTSATPRANAPILHRSEFKVSIWGCRAEEETSPAAASRYGRRTSCISVETARNLFVFDAGSGIVALGDSLLKKGAPREMWLFLTHFHLDHVEGLSDFPCARDPGFTLHIAGAADPDKTLQGSIAEAFAPGFGGGAPPCRLQLYEVREETYEILPGVRMTPFYANHPGTTFGYILTSGGRKIIYCPDSEIYGEAATALQDYDEKLGGLCRDADLLFHDGRYTDEDYHAQPNTGHSSFLASVDFAGKNNVKQLILVHQDGRYDDAALDAMAQAAEARVAERGYRLKVTLGREGLNLAV